MRRERLRPAYTDDDLATLYPKPHEHFGNLDHQIRVGVTIQVAKAVGPVETAADLACGDGAILAALQAKKRYWGDLADGWPIVGPIENTIEQIPGVDLFVATETVEHLDDPDTVLKAIRDKTRYLVLSTPVEAWFDAANPEHYWAWDRDAVEAMLGNARFGVVAYCELDLSMRGANHYKFGIWVCQ